MWALDAAGNSDYGDALTRLVVRSQRVAFLAKACLERAEESKPPEKWMLVDTWKRQQVKAEAAWCCARIKARIDYDAESGTVTDRIGWEQTTAEEV